MKNCPLCKTIITNFPLFDEHNGQFITKQGEFSVTTRAKQKIFKFLLENYGKVINIERIAIILWEYEDGPENEILVIHQHMFQIQQDIKNSGYMIESIIGAGYRVVAGEYVKRVYQYGN